MEQSQANPYETPTHSAWEPHASRSDNGQKEGLFSRFVFGIWAGVLFGGLWGAGGSVLFGVVGGAVLGWGTIGPGIHSLDSFVVIEVAAAIAGAIAGLLTGGIIGPLVGLVSGFTGQRTRPIIVMSTVLSMVAGAFIGLIGGQIIGDESGTSELAIWLGIPIGVLAGLIGGFQIGRCVLNFASSDSP
jgi:hypothetical protein